MTKDVAKMVNKIIRTAFRINEKGNHTVFFEFSGHTNGFSVQVHAGTWKVNRNVTEESRTYLDEDEAAVLNSLSSCLEMLRRYK